MRDVPTHDPQQPQTLAAGSDLSAEQRYRDLIDADIRRLKRFKAPLERAPLPPRGRLLPRRRARIDEADDRRETVYMMGVTAFSVRKIGGQGVIAELAPADLAELPLAPRRRLLASINKSVTMLERARKAGCG